VLIQGQLRPEAERRTLETKAVLGQVRATRAINLFDRTEVALVPATEDRQDGKDNPVIALAKMTMAARDRGKPSDSRTSLPTATPISPAIKISPQARAVPGKAAVMAKGVNW
jgi:hypothetical protein